MASKSEYSGRCHVAGEDVKLCRAGIDDLPDEILVTIFSYVSFSDLVDVVQKVCHRWRRLSQEMELWADKDYHIGIPSHCNWKNCKGSVTELEAIQIIQNAPNLCKVCIWHDVSPRLFRTLSEKCRRLKELRLRSTQKRSYSMLKNLVEKCSSLQMMRISDNLLRSEEFSEAVSRLRNLRVLRLDHDCTEGTSASQPCVLLRPLADGCPQLAEIDFGRSFANIDELRYFLNAKSNTLKSIRIKWTMGGTRSISPLLTVCANSLERLQLYETHLDRTAVTEAFTALGSLKNLRELMITLPDRLPPGSTALAFKNGGLPKLRALHLHNGCKLDDDAVIAISHGCSALRELSIKYAEKLSDTAFSQIYRLEHLEMELGVEGCRGDPKAVDGLTEQIPNLKVYGVVQAVESALYVTSDESDVEFAEENAVPENAYDTMDDRSESDRGSDGDISNSSDRM
ncbi:baculoviral IAP repeat-containing protein 1e-like isoform X2 [Schistocerca cancellata]|uniref:baculoviral IAP repeat-containing protein 1e-like isoform X2 n=1 Tax=Schistocerca cancellata TaxID=274614 RepID=UPI0021180BCB|nr:baculoviral IAP repeat-containing protein 1e-like isoform X2 [Schistocerca cancellata]